MSLARVEHVKRARKDQGECEKCHDALPPGSAYVWFTVGFRSKFKHKRCTKPTCYPKPSERESSAIADVYAAQESAEADISGAGSRDELESAVLAVAEAMREVAQQWQEASENDYGTVFNQDLADRAEQLESSADDLESNWEDVLDDEPEEEDKDTWGDYDTYEEAMDAWLADAREQVTSTINEVEIP